MAVSAREKKLLGKMWEKAEAQAGGTDLPWEDGKYQFQVLAASKKPKAKTGYVANSERPRFITVVKCVGGDEDGVGKVGIMNENLETAENMGWFKKKLSRLGIAHPKSFEEIMDGTVAEQMVGRVFDGQVRWKNDFPNIYVNRLVSADGDEEEEEEVKGSSKKRSTKKSSKAKARDEEEDDEEEEEEDEEDEGAEEEEEEEEEEDEEEDDEDEEEDGDEEEEEEDDDDDDDDDEEEDEEDEEGVDFPASTSAAKRVDAATAIQLLQAIGVEKPKKAAAKAQLVAAAACVAGEESKALAKPIRELAAAMGLKVSATAAVGLAAKKVKAAIEKAIG